MSRTDKDKPYWVDARWYAEHTIRCRTGRAECDLPESRPKRPQPWHRSDPRCDWTYEDLRTYQQAAHGVPRWFCVAMWERPQRTAVRDACHQVVAEYRGGEVVTMPSVDQHRHRAAWWWY
jgi:hypothetical protein